jgi:class 3 adenylate cyclase
MRASRSPLTGTATFLFTDIERSTALWEQYPEGARSTSLEPVERTCDEDHNPG